MTELGAPRRGHQAVVVSGAGDDLDNTMTRTVDAARRHGDADASRPGGTSRTAVPTRATTPTSRSTTAPAGRPSPAPSPRPPRATASTATQAGWTPGHLRPVGLRRQDGRPAGPVRHRRRGRGNGRRRADGIFVDDITMTAGGDDGVLRRCRDRRQRLDARRLRVGRRRRSTTFLRQLLHRRSPDLRRRTTSTSRPARTTSGTSTRSRTTSTTTRTSRVC